MPTSLRLLLDIETQIASFSARHGVTKSAVIVRSIQEFLANNAQPSSFEIFEQAMRAGTDAKTLRSDAQRELAEQRANKLQVGDALRSKRKAA